MKTQLRIPASVVLSCAWACSPGTPPDGGHAGEGASEREGPTNRIEIPVSVRRNLGLTFATVEARRVAQTIRIPGAFELQPSGRREYRMALPGRVEMLVDQYEAVEAGQVLYRFQSPAWPELLHEIIEGEQAMDTATAEIEVARAKIAATETQLELLDTRIAALASADFKRADLDAARAELKTSLPLQHAQLRLAETRLSNALRTREHALHRASTAAGISEHDLEVQTEVEGRVLPTYMTIDWIDQRAVEAGIVETLIVTDGAYVAPTGAVLSTVDPERVRFRALALQADLPELSGIREARIVPPQSANVAIGEGIDATVKFGLEAHPRERTLTLLATPEETAVWIRPGVSAFLEVVIDASAPQAMAVPRSAIVPDGLEHVLFRRDPADLNAAIRIEADMGVSDGRWVVLESGVMVGDEVVLHGAYELKLALDRSGEGPQSGHVHADGSVHDDH